MLFKVIGSIIGRQVEMVVDTGAERTFVCEGILPGCVGRCGNQQLCGVTGDCVPVKRPLWVNLAVGMVTERLPVLVAEMEDECLFGLDYLYRVEACVDLRKSRMSVRGYEVPLNPMGELAMRGVVEEPGRQKPQSVKSLGESHARRGRVGHTAPDTTSHHVPHPTTIINNKIGNEIGLPREERQRDCQEVLPEYLEDLTRRSTTQLTAEQATKVKALLAEYRDVFSSGDLDLGRTSLVQHSIYVRNSPPIKQAPRRVPPAKREEMEGLIREMETAGVIER